MTSSLLTKSYLLKDTVASTSLLLSMHCLSLLVVNLNPRSFSSSVQCSIIALPHQDYYQIHKNKLFRFGRYWKGRLSVLEELHSGVDSCKIAAALLTPVF